MPTHPSEIDEVRARVEALVAKAQELRVGAAMCHSLGAIGTEVIDAIENEPGGSCVVIAALTWFRCLALSIGDKENLRVVEGELPGIGPFVIRIPEPTTTSN